jgi:hypothetical protein
LAQLNSLNILSGNGQQIIPGGTLAPLRVLVANSCGPITDQQVRVNFQVVPPGTGKVTNGVAPEADSIVITADADGVATCLWKPDTQHQFQEVEATILADAAHPIVPPTSVRFNATLNIQHGGCEVVVGEGGQFERLDEAIRALIEAGHLNLCICLLPGTHTLPTGLDIPASPFPLHVKIQGCGRGSRIVLGEPSRIDRLSSFTLCDVELYTQSPITFDRCSDLSFEDCYLTQENQPTPFITISHARHIQFEDNIVVATLPILNNPASPVKVFESSAPNLSELYALPDRFEFEQKSAEVATDLAGQSTGKRRALVRQLQQSLTNFDTLTTAELTSYNDFSETLSETAVDKLLLQNRLAEIRLAALVTAPGVALVLMDAEADTRIEDNDITGTVSLYGVPGRARLPEEEMRRVAEELRRGVIRFTNSLSNLQVRDNILYRIDVSEAIIALLKSSGPSNVSLNRLYRRCFFTDNVFTGADNIFVMEHLSLASNSFEGSMDAGVVVANAAIYTGNYAPNDIRLFIVAGRGLRKDLNLTINVVEF